MAQPADTIFRECYDAHADSIFRFCLLKVSNRDVALDITQESFMRFWDQCVDGKRIENIRAFLFTVARNLVIDYYRKKKTDSLDVLSEAGFDPAEDAGVEEDAEYRRALSAIHTLDGTCRDLLIFRFVEDLPPREIATILDEAVNVISVRITRCMQKLRELMNPAI